MKRALNTDTLLGGLCVIIATFLLVSSYRQSENVFVLASDAPPFIVPQLFLYLMIGFSAALCLSGLRLGGETVGPKDWMRIALTAAVIVAAAALLKTIGYLAVAPVAVIFVVFLLGYKNHLLNIGVAVGFVAFLYLVLVNFAKMPLPKVPGLGF